MKANRAKEDGSLTPKDELALTKNQLQAVMDAIDAAILVVDRDLVVRFANKSIGEMWGLNPASLVGRKKPEAITSKIKYLFEDPEGFQNRLFWLYDHPHETAYDEIVMIQRERRLFARYTGPVLDDGHNILGRVEVYTDITKTRLMEGEIQRRNEELLAFREIAVVVSRSLDLRDVLDGALNKVLEVMRVESGCIQLEGETSETQRIAVSQGLSPQMLEGIYTYGPRFLRRLPDSEKDSVLILQGDLVSYPELANCPDLEKYQTLAIVPLLSKGCSLGRMYLVGETINPLLEERRGVLALIGCQIGAAVENANLFEETRRRQGMDRALHKVGTQILACLELERILGTVVQETRDLLQSDCSGIALFDESSGRFSLRSAAGYCHLKVGTAPCNGLSVQSCPLWVSTDKESLAELSHTMSEPRVSSDGQIHPARLWVPIRIGDRLTGGICTSDSARRIFSDDDASLLTGLANQAAIALENAALYEQVQQVAVLEERDRIAREMHDGLAQVLGYLKLRVDAVERLLNSGEESRARGELESMKEVIDETYENVRGAITGLKTIIKPGPDFLSSVGETLHHFGIEHDIETKLVIKDEDLPLLSIKIQIQLIRVIQECLSNVSKHAKASEVGMTFEKIREGVRMTIEDDGLGFDPSRLVEPSWRRIGLRTMRERIESVGGSFQIETSPGCGTKVIVEIPSQKEIRDGTVESIAG